MAMILKVKLQSQLISAKKSSSLKEDLNKVTLHSPFPEAWDKSSVHLAIPSQKFGHDLQNSVKFLCVLGYVICMFCLHGTKHLDVWKYPDDRLKIFYFDGIFGIINKMHFHSTTLIPSAFEQAFTLCYLRLTWESEKLHNHNILTPFCISIFIYNNCSLECHKL